MSMPSLQVVRKYADDHRLAAVGRSTGTGRPLTRPRFIPKHASRYPDWGEQSRALLADVDPIIRQPALMIYGAQDMVVRNERLADFVPDVTEVELDCGHWIMDEMPEETDQAILTWLEQQGTPSRPTFSNNDSS